MPLALIVEDDLEANKLLAMLLRLRGYETDSAFGGIEAIERIKRQPPDVVFLDLMLPDMDGYEVCQLLKKSETSIRRVPVVIVTARIAAENRIESFGVGADDYVPKPYTPDDIFDALDVARDQSLTDGEADLEGRVWLDLRDDGQTLRGLARLRRAILSRCPNDSRTINAIKLAWLSADRWSRQHDCQQVATMDYQVVGDRLTLLLRGEPDWLAASFACVSGVPGDAKAWSAANWIGIAQSVFDELHVDRSEHVVRMVSYLRALDPDLEHLA